ncbi:Peptidoglycan/LPS O-acetylase OafA/YrhL, contains acyltransferase and SGNH-hydrolase domains [Malonomonas rubra DSM 5091]|uniref:Peptidoglycan/LPS O-acetylase OafA/YrhL, contains acyltransferase and SGNH-hydrolase domains n=1 Tax=Malonomonas rubra DSM 5091 TaxID=1122189 RepID=A0A1M6KDG2_MALRU|nr:acyltransferase [Malonomonas rubra]SHJ56985.1 Peptidoglycan/LPS O-acetylase OafA/YrhL, contains acyltransferase and SGNH-hydrolase domains [Malonomonas rubra DSM 5091]
MRIPSLDGIRCIAVVFVLLSHTRGTVGFYYPQFIAPLFGLGNLGVRIFFVLSGYLITTLLLLEREKYGQISLKKFYMRRTIRIFPALYFYVFCIFIADYLGWLDLTALDFIYSITYTVNYYFDSSWQVGHLWSLAVEEQFYLLWPLTLLLLGNKRGLLFACGVILVVPVIRVLTWQFMPSQFPGIGATFHTVCDALATGCVLAGIRYYWGTPSLWGRSVGGWLVPLLVILVFFLNYFRGSISLSYPIGYTLLNICIALLIEWATRLKNGISYSILNSKIFVYIGTLSYSLYLWQQPFLNRKSDLIYNSFPLNILLVFVAALVSYYLVEKPILSLRSRYSRL